MPALTRTCSLLIGVVSLLTTVPKTVCVFADGFSEHLVDGAVVGISHDGPAAQVVTDLQRPASRKRLKHVEWVSLKHHVIEPAEISAFAALPQLRRIEIGYFPDEVILSNRVFSALAEIQTLKELEIYGTFSDKDGVGRISTIPQLEVLAVSSGITSNDSFWDAIGEHLKLSRLQLATDRAIDDFQWLTNLRSLETLELDAVKLEGSVVPAVNSLPRLTELSLRGVLLDRNSIGELAETNELQNVDIVVAPDVSFRDLATLKTLRQLAVRLTGKGANEKDLSPLTAMTRLQSLRLHGWYGARTDAERLLSAHPALTEISVFGKAGDVLRYKVKRKLP